MQGSDGTLVAEFRLAERLHRQNVLTNTYETVTCAAANGVSFHQCADVAGAATIAEDEASKWSVEADDVYYGDLAGYLDSSNANPFGVQCGSDMVGDGVVNTFDIAVFAFAMFNRAPYNVPLTTQTVVMRSDLAQECNNQTTRADWQSKLSSSFCPSNSGRRRNLRKRRLAELDPISEHIDFWEHARVEGGVHGSGTWYQISINGIQSIVEIVMDGVWAEYPVSLVNEPYPRKDDAHTHLPDNLNKIELRWARKMEFLNMPTTSCSSIVNGISGTIAMEGDTIGVRQEGTSTQLLCAFVIFLYVPDTVLTSQPFQPFQPFHMKKKKASTRRLSSDGIPNVQVLSGSTWRYPKQGHILETDTVSVRSNGYFVIGANMTLAQPPPPPSDDKGIPATAWLLIILFFVLLAILCVLVWCCFSAMNEKRRKEEEEEEQKKFNTSMAQVGSGAGYARKPLMVERVPLLKINHV